MNNTVGSAESRRRSPGSGGARRDSQLCFSQLLTSYRHRDLDELWGGFHAHAARALEESPFLDAQHRRVDVGGHPGARMNLDALARVNGSLEGPVDRDAL